MLLIRNEFRPNFTLPEDFCKESPLPGAGFQKGGVHILELFLDFRIGKHLLHHPIRGKDLSMLLHPFLGFDQGNVLGLIRLWHPYGFIFFQRQSPRPPLLCSVFYYNKFLSVLPSILLYPLLRPKKRTKKGQRSHKWIAGLFQNENRVSISPGVSRTDVGTPGLPLLQGFQKLGKTVVVETKACKHWSRVLWLQISLTTTPVYCRAVSGIPTARLGYGHVGWASFIVGRSSFIVGR